MIIDTVVSKNDLFKKNTSIHHHAKYLRKSIKIKFLIDDSSFFHFSEKNAIFNQKTQFFIMSKWCFYESAMSGTTNENVGVDVFSIVFEKNANPLNPPYFDILCSCDPLLAA